MLINTENEWFTLRMRDTKIQVTIYYLDWEISTQDEGYRNRDDALFTVKGLESGWLFNTVDERYTTQSV